MAKGSIRLGNDLIALRPWRAGDEGTQIVSCLKQLPLQSVLFDLRCAYLPILVLILLLRAGSALYIIMLQRGPEWSDYP